jgi:hypothetical protein
MAEIRSMEHRDYITKRINVMPARVLAYVRSCHCGFIAWPSILIASTLSTYVTRSGGS